MTATITKKVQKDTERDEALAELRKMLKPGDTVYTVIRSVSASGMSRRMDLYVIRKNVPHCISGYVGRILDYKRSNKDGLLVAGVGMDMGFHLVPQGIHSGEGGATRPQRERPKRTGHGRRIRAESKVAVIDLDSVGRVPGARPLDGGRTGCFRA